MIPLSVAAIAQITGGSMPDPAYADVVVTAPAFLDSRDPERGGLFLAIAGENVDGHDYAERALAGGAAAVLASRAVAGPVVVVADVQEALGRLATWVVTELRGLNPDLRVLAVTGSQGKTSVKDMLGAVLGDAGPTVATYGSFNNELGLPLTVLRAVPQTRFLVLEMGARGIGHLAELCAIVAPDISLVLNVGQAHLGEFGSQENIALAKGELVEALGPDGVALLNADDPRVAAMAGRTRALVRTFGTSPGATLRLSEVDLDDVGRPSFVLEHGSERAEVRLRLLGAHQAINAAAAALGAMSAGLGLGEVAQSLASIASLSKWRMELAERRDGLVVINDAYNANPESMTAALRTLAEIGRRTGRPTIAVLGEMRELGDAADEQHRAVAALAKELGIGQLVVVGEGARAMTEADDTATFFATVRAATDGVRNNVDGTEVVLVKASRAARLERLADALLANEAAKATETEIVDHDRTKEAGR